MANLLELASCVYGSGQDGSADLDGVTTFSWATLVKRDGLGAYSTPGGAGGAAIGTGVAGAAGSAVHANLFGFPL